MYRDAEKAQRKICMEQRQKCVQSRDVQRQRHARSRDAEIHREETEREPRRLVMNVRGGGLVGVGILTWWSHPVLTASSH